jgi:hypothetical protein
MSLTIELTPEQEAELAAQAKRAGVDPAEIARRLLAASLPTASNAERRQLTPEERIPLMDAMTEMNRGLPHLPDSAFDRENIY